MGKSIVFRRFARFDEALTFALSIRKDHDLIQVIWSPEREPRNNDLPPLGPWCVTDDGGMIRVWERVCAQFERGVRGKIDRVAAADIERRNDASHAIVGSRYIKGGNTL